MGFPKQEYWSRLPFAPPGDLPNPGKEPRSPASPALADVFFTIAPPVPNPPPPRHCCHRETPNTSDLFSHSCYNFIPRKWAHLGNSAAPLPLSPLALECQLWDPFNVKGNGSSWWGLRIFRQGEKLASKQINSSGFICHWWKQLLAHFIWVLPFAL